MEDRVAKLEAIADSTVAAVAALRTDMNERFKLVDIQLAELRRQKVETDVVLSRLDRQASQIASLREDMERQFQLTNQRFAQVDARFAQVDARFDQIERRLDQQDEVLKELRTELRYVTRWLFGAQCTIMIFLLGLAAKVIFVP